MTFEGPLQPKPLYNSITYWWLHTVHPSSFLSSLPAVGVGAHLLCYRTAKALEDNFTESLMTRYRLYVEGITANCKQEKNMSRKGGMAGREKRTR